MKKRVREGDLLPAYYRVAYHDITRYVGVCYPIGIHWIVRGCRRLWEWSLNYRQSAYEREMLESYRKGEADGMRRVADANAIAAFIRGRGKSTSVYSGMDLAENESLLTGTGCEPPDHGLSP